jgi:hypothetical protein
MPWCSMVHREALMINSSTSSACLLRERTINVESSLQDCLIPRNGKEWSPLLLSSSSSYHLRGKILRLQHSCFLIHLAIFFTNFLLENNVVLSFCFTQLVHDSMHFPYVIKSNALHGNLTMTKTNKQKQKTNTNFWVAKHS